MRSRTATSTSTAASTRRRSCARRSRTSRRAPPSRADRRSPSSWSGTSTSPNPQEDIQRKIQEAVMADQLESKHSKQWILTKYLNTASYGTTDGRTAVGVQAAAETYFAKGVKDLTLPEAALIAGLPQAPSEYNPLQNPKAALQRRNEVLQALEQQGYINRRDYESALAERAGPRPGLQVPADQAAVLLRLRPAAADRQVRRQHRPERRPQGLHDDQLGAPGRRPERASTPALSATRAAARRRRSPRSTPRTATSLRWPPPRRTRPARSSTSRPTPTASPGPRSSPTCLRPPCSRG